MRPRVWAPAAGRVDLDVDGARRPMADDGAGWWVATDVDLPPGTRYAVALDGGPAWPDPAARRLPEGVHGPAEVVDHDAFRWTDAGWSPPSLRDGAVYELHVGTFSSAGTFDGAVGHLDHLVELGISHVELMPVHSFPGRFGWGYDVAGLSAPHEPYGGPDSLKRLVDACHARGLAVLLDVVYNHLGPEGAYRAAFGPYLTDRYRTPWGPAVNVGGPGADEVRASIVDDAIGWLRDYHLDGLRLDAVHALVDLTAVHLLEQLADAVRALAERLERRLVLVAESERNDPRLLRPPELGGDGLDALWNDDLHHALHVALTGERSGYYADFDGLPDLATALESIWVLDGRYSVVRGRHHGRPPTGLDPDRFIAFAQNHDQIGNRAQGERLAQLAGLPAARVAATLILAGPFVPLLFQGEEWAASTPFQFFADLTEPALRDALRDGRRTEFAAFGWEPDAIPDPTDEATFRRSVLRWAEVDREPHAGMLDWHRRLLSLRRAEPALRDGVRPTVRAQPGEGWLVVERPGATIAANLGASTRHVPLPDRAHRLAAASEPGILAPADGRLALPPMSAAVLLT